MAKFSPNMAAIKEEIPSSQRSAMNVSDVKRVSVQELHINPSNAEFFPIEDAQRFEQLKNDIRERGIIVPLLAKRDNTLLAGHNRLKAATELGLEYVPVQYVQEQLSAEQEREFLIKDNLLRRQFTGKEWIEIYRKLYPDFDERIVERKRGGDRTSNSEAKNEQRDNVPLTAKRVALDTGQKEEAVKKQLQRHKEKVQAKTTSAARKASTPLQDECKKLASDIAKSIAQQKEEKTLRKIQQYLEKAASLLVS